METSHRFTVVGTAKGYRIKDTQTGSIVSTTYRTRQLAADAAAMLNKDEAGNVAEMR